MNTISALSSSIKPNEPYDYHNHKKLNRYLIPN